MKNEKYCVMSFLDALKNHDSNSGNEMVEVYEQLVKEQSSLYFQLYSEQNFEQLGQYLDSQRKLRRVLTKELKKQTNPIVLLANQFVQNFNIFNKLLQNTIGRESFAEEMQLIVGAYSGAEQVIHYLYKHPRTQHKVLAEQTDIPKSTLSDLLKVLDEVQCVVKIKKGKFCFYELTDAGETYVKKNNPHIDKETVIDVNSVNYISVKYKNLNDSYSGYVLDLVNEGQEKVKMLKKREYMLAQRSNAECIPLNEQLLKMAK